MTCLRPGAFLGLVVLAAACGDDGGENLSDSGFTTGDPSTGSASGTMTGSASTSTSTMMSTSNGPTTDETTETSSSTTMELTATESSTTMAPTTDPTTTTNPTETTEATIEPTTTTIEPTTTTGPVGECGDMAVDDGLVCFGTATDFAVGLGPADVDVGDFDGDGDMDIATVNADGGDVSVRLGNGAGGFGEVLSVAIGGTNPIRLAAADLNADGMTDLVTVNFDSGDVSVLLATGAGAFADSVEVAVGAGPTDLDLQLLDAGTSPDLIVANSGDANYITALNDGAGGFTIHAEAPWSTGGVGGAVGIVVGPINGAPNDVWFCEGNAWGAVQGDGDGSINPMAPIVAMTGAALGRANRGDANADFDMDIVAVDATNDLAYFFVGGVQAAFAATGLDAGADPSEGLLADVTGEGDEDVVVSSQAENTVTVFPGNGAGMVGSGITFDVGNGPTGVAVADLNGDGVGDIIVSNGDDDTVSVLLSDP